MKDDLTPSGRTIPAYTKAFEARNAQSQRDTLRKLGKEFGFDPEHPPVDPRKLEIIDNPAYKMMEKFNRSIDTCCDRTGVTLDEQQRAELVGVCRDFARSVGEHYQIRGFIEQAAKRAHEIEEARAREAAGTDKARLWELHEGEENRREIKVRHAQEMENAYASHLVEKALVKMRSYLREEGDNRQLIKIKDSATVGLLGGVIRELINNCNFPVNLIEPFRRDYSTKEGFEEDVMGGLLEKTKKSLGDRNRNQAGR